MKWKTVLSLAMIIGLLGSTAACGVDFSGSSESDEDDLAEQVKVLQLTVQALQIEQTAMYQNLAQTQAAQEQVQVAQEQVQPTATQQAAPSATPDPNATLTPTPIPCNLPQFQSETVPDGTQKDAGQHFAKTWRVKNTGSCTWNSGYRLVFVAGDKMGGPTSQALAQDVRPGESIDLIVDLTAPASNGEYRGTWKLQSNEGEQFGNYWVLIRVGPPQASFAVTRVIFDVNPSIEMLCPDSARITATITTNAAGNVTYRWRDSVGGSTHTESLTFSQAGSQSVKYKTTINASGDYSAELYIDAPNHQWFGPVEYHVKCTS